MRHGSSYINRCFDKNNNELSKFSSISLYNDNNRYYHDIPSRKQFREIVHHNMKINNYKNRSWGNIYQKNIDGDKKHQMSTSVMMIQKRNHASLKNSWDKEKKEVEDKEKEKEGKPTTMQLIKKYG